MKKPIILRLSLMLVIGFAVVAVYVVAQPISSGSSEETLSFQSVPAITVTKSTNNLPAIDPQEASDAHRLVEALNLGDAKAAVAILRAYGLADDTLQTMSARIGHVPERCELSEEFLKTSELPLGGRATNVQANIQAATAIGYVRPVWPVRWPETNWISRCDTELERSPLAPIAVLNVVDISDCIRFVKWYDRYAEHLHSVVLNENLSNAKLDADDGYDQAMRTLNALFQLIKVRKPDAFVWLSVVKQDNRSDEKWLKALPFKPDGLQISNLRQFHSPFAETRRRYTEILGEDLPMMVSGFIGHKEALQAKGKTLSAAKKIQDPLARRAAKENAMKHIGGIGDLMGQDLERYATYMQSLGYRGLSADWLLIEALNNKDKAVKVGKSDIVDPRAGELDQYFLAKDYKSMADLTATMLSESSPGDMTWTVAKLYEGIALLSRDPAEVQQAILVLDEVLNFDFRGRSGRDHYILGAVKWRMHAASLVGDNSKIARLQRWVENQDFRADLKTDFLKKSKGNTSAKSK